MRGLGISIMLMLVFIAASSRANTASDIAAICTRAGTIAAQKTGVPHPVLSAIMLTETGRKIDGRHQPWPWTVNMEGTGKWFATREEALAYVMEHYNKGARSFDVGCFQINFRWHGNAFASIEDMFDPTLNALYAGQFLRTLYKETGSWTKSAGAYHSRTPKYATKYSARFDRIIAQITGKQTPLPAPSGGEYVHNMTPSELLGDTKPVPTGTQVARVESDVPWVPPPPSKFGSLASVDHLPAGPPLLTRARRGLY